MQCNVGADEEDVFDADGVNLENGSTARCGPATSPVAPQFGDSCVATLDGVEQSGVDSTVVEASALPGVETVTHDLSAGSTSWRCVELPDGDNCEEAAGAEGGGPPLVPALPPPPVVLLQQGPPLGLFGPPPTVGGTTRSGAFPQRRPRFASTTFPSQHGGAGLPHPPTAASSGAVGPHPPCHTPADPTGLPPTVPAVSDADHAPPQPPLAVRGGGEGEGGTGPAWAGAECQHAPEQPASDSGFAVVGSGVEAGRLPRKLTICHVVMHAQAPTSAPVAALKPVAFAHAHTASHDFNVSALFGGSSVPDPHSSLRPTLDGVTLVTSSLNDLFSSHPPAPWLAAPALPSPVVAVASSAPPDAFHAYPLPYAAAPVRPAVNGVGIPRPRGLMAPVPKPPTLAALLQPFAPAATGSDSPATASLAPIAVPQATPAGAAEAQVPAAELHPSDDGEEDVGFATPARSTPTTTPPGTGRGALPESVADAWAFFSSSDDSAVRPVGGEGAGALTTEDLSLPAPPAAASGPTSVDTAPAGSVLPVVSAQPAPPSPPVVGPPPCRTARFGAHGVMVLAGTGMRVHVAGWPADGPHDNLLAQVASVIVASVTAAADAASVSAMLATARDVSMASPGAAAGDPVTPLQATASELDEVMMAQYARDAKSSALPAAKLANMWGVGAHADAGAVGDGVSDGVGETAAPAPSALGACTDSAAAIVVQWDVAAALESALSQRHWGLALLLARACPGSGLAQRAAQSAVTALVPPTSPLHLLMLASVHDGFHAALAGLSHDTVSAQWRRWAVGTLSAGLPTSAASGAMLQLAHATLAATGCRVTAHTILLAASLEAVHLCRGGLIWLPGVDDAAWPAWWTCTGGLARSWLVLAAAGAIGTTPSHAPSPGLHEGGVAHMAALAGALHDHGHRAAAAILSADVMAMMQRHPAAAVPLWAASQVRDLHERLTPARGWMASLSGLAGVATTLVKTAASAAGALLTGAISLVATHAARRRGVRSVSPGFVSSRPRARTMDDATLTRAAGRSEAADMGLPAAMDHVPAPAAVEGAAAKRSWLASLSGLFTGSSVDAGSAAEGEKRRFLAVLPDDDDASKPYYDEVAKTWVFPGDPQPVAASAQPPPPTAVAAAGDLGTRPDTAAGGLLRPPPARKAAPGNHSTTSSRPGQDRAALAAAYEAEAAGPAIAKAAMGLSKSAGTVPPAHAAGRSGFGHGGLGTMAATPTSGTPPLHAPQLGRGRSGGGFHEATAEGGGRTVAHEKVYEVL